MQGLQIALLWAAFWVALCGSAPRTGAGVGDAEGPARRVVGLAVAGLLAHLGWLALHPDAVWAAGLAAAALPLRGFSLLFVPAGPLLVAPWSRGCGAALRQLAPVFRVLPLALAVARAGCLAGGCCLGRPAAGDGRLHPVRVYEIVGWLALAGLLRRLPAERAAAVFLVGFGALRGLLEPLRAPDLSVLGAPAGHAPAWLAGAWLGLGAVLMLFTGGGGGGGAVGGRR